ncbi:DinB family protein [Emticicia sp. C21]|uniref:DinB family protein n=1 Tax=Emticicia sp. C21 TaxID=2302915 RepID=UPI000E34E502|nr:DinB family protein [Emticicia sp. C21]RFS14234.1 DinB family protein [Emticicia sp. C21]
MKKLILFLLISMSATAQNKLWTENDRQELIANLKKTKDSLIKETQSLSIEQWNFRESPERWTIGEIVEHLGLWERIFARETNIALRSKPTPELNASSKPDSWYIDFMMEEKVHNAPDYARPMGFALGKDNLTTFLKIREQTIRFVETTQADLKAHFEPVGGENYRNVHQIFIVQYGHVSRHIRQIKKVKTHPNYPAL